MVHIYALVDPTTFEIRYIGATKRPPADHVRTPVSDAHRHWLAALSAHGSQPCVVILQTVNDADAHVTELKWVTTGHELGWPLLNVWPLPHDQRRQADEELRAAALRVLELEGRCSITLLQKRLRIGFVKAAALVDELEEAGIVGPDTQSNAGREVLCTST